MISILGIARLSETFTPNVRCILSPGRKGGWLWVSCCLGLAVAEAQPGGTVTAEAAKRLETAIIRASTEMLKDTSLDQSCSRTIQAFKKALGSAPALSADVQSANATERTIGQRLRASQLFLSADLKQCDTVPVATLVGEAKKYRGELEKLLVYVQAVKAQQREPANPKKATGQPTASLRVKVVDATAGQEVKAGLTLFKVDTAITNAGAGTDSAGYFNASLRPGRYVIRATADQYHLSDSDVTVAGQPVSFILPVTKKADHQRANRPVAGTAAPLDADFIRNHSGWIALLGILSALSLVSVILHVGAYAQNALAARKKRLSANAPSATAHSAHGSPLPDDLLREVNRNVSQLNTSLRAVQGGALAAAASKQGGTASVRQTHRYFLCELMMTAGPRKKFMNEPNADLDLGEDVCGLIAGSQRVFVWVLDGTSDLHCMRNPANGREYFSSRLLAQGVANQLRKLTGEKPALPLEEMVHQAIEGVRADWLVAINQLPDEEKQSLRKNIKSKNFPECASTLLAGQLTLHGDLLAYRSGDSKMVLFAATPAGPIRAIPTSLAGKNEAANDRIFFRLVLDAHDHLTIQMNQPAYEIIRQQNIAALIAFSDGIGASTEHLLKNEYEVQPAEARSELICQVQGTADDKSICFIEIKESELPAEPASTG